MRPPFAALLLLALPAAALAQDRPVLQPMRDATIDYQVEGSGTEGPRSLRMMFAAGGQKLRIDMPGQPGFMVMDRLRPQGRPEICPQGHRDHRRAALHRLGKHRRACGRRLRHR